MKASSGIVYVLLSGKDAKTYTGSTNDFEKRFSEHQRGMCRATKNRRPLRLIHSEGYETLVEARKREKYLKTAAGRKVLRKILEESNFGE